MCRSTTKAMKSRLSTSTVVGPLRTQRQGARQWAASLHRAPRCRRYACSLPGATTTARAPAQRLGWRHRRPAADPPTHPRRRMPWRPPQQLRGSPPPQPPPPPGRGAHLQARRVVRVEAQNASTAAARRPAARRRAPRGSRPLRHRAAACRARARASRPLGDGASSVSLRHAERGRLSGGVAGARAGLVRR